MVQTCDRRTATLNDSLSAAIIDVDTHFRFGFLRPCGGVYDRRTGFQELKNGLVYFVCEVVCKASFEF